MSDQKPMRRVSARTSRIPSGRGRPRVCWRLLDKKLSEATVNRRLAAIRSLLKFAHRLGLSQTDGRGLVDSEKFTAYRDTRAAYLIAAGHAGDTRHADLRTLQRYDDNREDHQGAVTGILSALL